MAASLPSPLHSFHVLFHTLLMQKKIIRNVATGPDHAILLLYPGDQEFKQDREETVPLRSRVWDF